MSRVATYPLPGYALRKAGQQVRSGRGDRRNTGTQLAGGRDIPEGNDRSTTGSARVVGDLRANSRGRTRKHVAGIIVRI